MPETATTPGDATPYAQETFRIIDAKNQTLLVNNEPGHTELIVFGPKGSVKAKLKLNQRATDALITNLALNNLGWAPRLGAQLGAQEPA